MKEVKKVVEIKEGRVYRETFTTTDATEVYKSLAHDLTAKKLCNASYIKSIRRTSNYDGTVKITVYYDNDVRSVYTVEG